MLKINMEFRKGILFVRLKGELNKYTYKGLNDYLSPIIEEQGIKYLVINLACLNKMDKYGIESLEKHIKETDNNNGYTLICNSKFNFRSKFRTIDNELTALKIINI